MLPSFQHHPKSEEGETPKRVTASAISYQRDNPLALLNNLPVTLLILALTPV